MITKQCTSCNTDKPLHSFYKQALGAHGVTSWCKPCAREKAKKYSKGRYAKMTSEQKAAAAARVKRWKKDNPERAKSNDRRSHLKHRYDMQLEEYEQMYSDQQGKCAICGKTEEVLDVDHCHESNVIRGLLCHRCNWALGILGDTQEHLEAASHYFARNAKKWNKGKKK